MKIAHNDVSRLIFVKGDFQLLSNYLDEISQSFSLYAKSTNYMLKNVKAFTN